MQLEHLIDDLGTKGAVLVLPEARRQVVMLGKQVQGVKAWTCNTIRREDWEIRLPDEAAEELRTIIQAGRRCPLPLLLVRPEQFSLPRCGELMDHVKTVLDQGVGIAVVDRLPVDEWTSEEATTAYWVLGQLLSRPVATKWDGTMLYQVRDSGRPLGYGVRGSTTNVELTFHTDNAFGASLPDYVGLLCHQPAAHGGTSRFCSLYSVHNEMLSIAPQLLRRLYQPMLFDRQAEHEPHAPKVIVAPMFSYDVRGLRARLVPGLVRRGYDMMGVTLDQALSEALDCLAEVMTAEQLRVEFTIERGQLQYVNNLEYAHYRSAFIDDPIDDKRKRHLVRTWYRNSGAQSYDG